MPAMEMLHLYSDDDPSLTEQFAEGTIDEKVSAVRLAIEMDRPRLVDTFSPDAVIRDLVRSDLDSLAMRALPPQVRVWVAAKGLCTPEVGEAVFVPLLLQSPGHEALGSMIRSLPITDKRATHIACNQMAGLGTRINVASIQVIIGAGAEVDSFVAACVAARDDACLKMVIAAAPDRAVSALQGKMIPAGVQEDVVRVIRRSRVRDAFRKHFNNGAPTAPERKHA